MKKNIRKVLCIFLIIFFLIFSIIGIDRFDKRIIITQFAPQTDRQQMGYMIKTNKEKIVMIDGGTIGDAKHVEHVIKKNGGIVDYWFITHAHDDHFGTLLTILQDENSGIEIKNIILSFNLEKWYEENDNTRYESYCIKDLFCELNKEENLGKIHNAELNEIINIDNLNFKILKITSPEITENAGNNQSMVIKVDNGYKSILFLGDLSESAEDVLINNNSDELDCDIVQMAHHGQAGVSEKLYNLISPEICLWPTPEWLWNNDLGEGFNTASYKTIETRKWIEKLKVKKNYVAKDGDQTIEFY